MLLAGEWRKWAGLLVLTWVLVFNGIVGGTRVDTLVGMRMQC